MKYIYATLLAIYILGLGFIVEWMGTIEIKGLVWMVAVVIAFSLVLLIRLVGTQNWSKK